MNNDVPAGFPPHLPRESDHGNDCACIYKDDGFKRINADPRGKLIGM